MDCSAHSQLFYTATVVTVLPDLCLSQFYSINGITLTLTIKGGERASEKKDTCIVTKQCGHVECQRIGRAMVITDLVLNSIFDITCLCCLIKLRLSDSVCLVVYETLSLTGACGQHKQFLLKGCLPPHLSI